MLLDHIGEKPSSTPKIEPTPGLLPKRSIFSRGISLKKQENPDRRNSLPYKNSEPEEEVQGIASNQNNLQRAKTNIKTGDARIDEIKRVQNLHIGEKVVKQRFQELSLIHI
eukprot:TRINITY_DN26398_c0_g1_i1.p1 TRINITY_DN26398_c0_g1~~TRINITY_DN26398_c0_g1_i1.p1  ORF type:complete len:111 (-),score=14.79 TRINITY_DN26398_c0_g1_i1:35-367(-)